MAVNVLVVLLENGGHTGATHPRLDWLHFSHMLNGQWAAGGQEQAVEQVEVRAGHSC